MIEYQDILNVYSLKGYEMYAKTTSPADWGNKEIASKYLDRYWLKHSEYDQKWKPIMQQIFEHKTVGLPEKIFKSQFELIAFAGGTVITENEYILLQQCMQELGEKEFVVIENNQCNRNNWPFYRMKFSTYTSWDELKGGNFASSMWLDSLHKEFFIFGDSGRWGRYSATDYDYPMDIFGVEHNNLDVFTSRFSQSASERQEVLDNLPTYYKDKLYNC